LFVISDPAFYLILLQIVDFLSIDLLFGAGAGVSETTITHGIPICHSEVSPRRDTKEESGTDASEGIPECFPQHDIFYQILQGLLSGGFLQNDPGCAWTHSGIIYE